MKIDITKEKIVLDGRNRTIIIKNEKDKDFLELNDFDKTFEQAGIGKNFMFINTDLTSEQIFQAIQEFQAKNTNKG